MEHATKVKTKGLQGPKIKATKTEKGIYHDARYKKALLQDSGHYRRTLHVHHNSHPVIQPKQLTIQDNPRRFLIKKCDAISKETR